MVHSQVQLQVRREGKILKLCFFTNGYLFIFEPEGVNLLMSLLLPTMQAFMTIVGLCFAVAALMFFGLTILWA